MSLESCCSYKLSAAIPVSLCSHGKRIVLSGKGEHEPFKWQNQCLQDLLPNRKPTG